MEMFVPGQWYLFTAPGGFTLLGKYVCPFPFGFHRFERCAYLRNAGGRYLGDLCAKGVTSKTEFTPPFPKHWTGVPLWFAEWEAPVPWAKS